MARNALLGQWNPVYDNSENLTRYMGQDHQRRRLRTIFRERKGLSGSSSQRWLAPWKGQIPKIGQIVPVHDENLPRGAWKLGKIIYLLASTDKEVRSAVVQMPNGHHLNRPINSLYPLEVE
ncbi:unnamed protein product [Toxocara canis]|uniref:DUF5641 domain-containing protein n=1 Tax=Toxocara canis TaxID=6265 RepID=A0A183V9R2_TOXCA|nr:unnamed protein product [Toxocara canis]